MQLFIFWVGKLQLCLELLARVVRLLKATPPTPEECSSFIQAVPCLLKASDEDLTIFAATLKSLYVSDPGTLAKLISHAYEQHAEVFIHVTEPQVVDLILLLVRLEKAVMSGDGKTPPLSLFSWDSTYPLLRKYVLADSSNQLVLCRGRSSCKISDASFFSEPLRSLLRQRGKLELTPNLGDDLSGLVDVLASCSSAALNLLSPPGLVTVAVAEHIFGQYVSDYCLQRLNNLGLDLATLVALEDSVRRALAEPSKQSPRSRLTWRTLLSQIEDQASTDPKSAFDLLSHQISVPSCPLLRNLSLPKDLEKKLLAERERKLVSIARNALASIVAPPLPHAVVIQENGGCAFLSLVSMMDCLCEDEWESCVHKILKERLEIPFVAVLRICPDLWALHTLRSMRAVLEEYGAKSDRVGAIFANLQRLLTDPIGVNAHKPPASASPSSSSSQDANIKPNAPSNSSRAADPAAPASAPASAAAPESVPGPAPAPAPVAATIEVPAQAPPAPSPVPPPAAEAPALAAQQVPPPPNAAPPVQAAAVVPPAWRATFTSLSSHARIEYVIDHIATIAAGRPDLAILIDWVATSLDEGNKKLVEITLDAVMNNKSLVDDPAAPSRTKRSALMIHLSKLFRGQPKSSQRFLSNLPEEALKSLARLLDE
eukprot:TRINITY_DN13448_c0_g1_i1.p1 TRINITY_DN13448_c0_g1~~TRINITY_DN13448_c0_g1_i1.p1  ORF type:complete len:656 (-),score=121.95 TRINITY_DN13448_c0_g1_i1:1260-3227(-)